MTNSNHTKIIAEAGVNHNGELDLAIELVDRAADAGADFVKFQTFQAVKLATISASKANYQKATTDNEESQFEMLKRLELSSQAHHRLVDHCSHKNIHFLSSAFDLSSVNFLSNELRLNTLKLGSGELTNAPILLAAARSGMDLFVSTGMGTLAEVEEALGVLAFGLIRKSEPVNRMQFSEVLNEPQAWAALRRKITLLHCTTEYPAAVEDTNLRAVDTMRMAFGLRLGYSDHTEGNAMCIAAVARGAEVIEKHFTLDRKMSGPDHAASMEPNELAALVNEIRNTEVGLGDGVKRPSRSEINNRGVVRRSVVARRDLPPNTAINIEDITVKRPGSGISAISYWDCIGRKVIRPIRADTPLRWEDLAWAD